MYVVYAGLGASSYADDIIYISGDDYDTVASGEYENEDVYFVETGDQETLVFDDEYDDKRFFEVDDVDADDVYSLNEEADDYDVPAGLVDEDSDDGAIEDLVISMTEGGTDHVRSGVLTTQVYSSGDEPKRTAAGGKEFTFDDVSLSNATIIDTRGSSTRDGDVYTREITSVSRLDAALDEGDVTVDLYLLDGEVAFLAVTAVDDSDSVDDDDRTVTGAEVLEAYLADTTIAGYVNGGIDMTAESVNSTDVTAYVEAAFEAVSGAAVAGTEYDVSVTSVYMNGSYTPPAAGGSTTAQVTVTLSAQGTEAASVTQQVTVTVRVTQGTV